MHAERILKALANRRRLAILGLLEKRGELSVAEIASGIKLSFKATSKHLLILAHVDIVDRRQESLTVFYRLAKPVAPLVRAALNLL
jgi:DNA-binding transcriptional ArsR family regulator